MPGRPVLHEGNRVSDHYPHLPDFEQDLHLAEERAKTIEQREFLRGLRARWGRFGKALYLSSNQAGYLRRLANSAD